MQGEHDPNGPQNCKSIEPLHEVRTLFGHVPSWRAYASRPDAIGGGHGTERFVELLGEESFNVLRVFLTAPGIPSHVRAESRAVFGFLAASTDRGQARAVWMRTLCRVTRTRRLVALPM